MGKYVITWSYWLGVLSAVLALLTRGLDILGVKILTFSTRGAAIGYHTFLDGALFFFVISIATTTYAGFSSEKR